MISAELVNRILGVDDSYKTPENLLKMMLDDEKRPKLFDEFLEHEPFLSRDWFVDYFQEEHAERKRFNQDFTPEAVGNLLAKLVGGSNKYFESAAGSGGLMIKAWHQHRMDAGPSRFDSRSYWYHLEELSDRTVPFLIFNMAIRGMNGVILHGDSLSRVFKNVYFIRNDTSDFLRYSEVIVMPKTEMLQREFDIRGWSELVEYEKESGDSE